MSCCADLCNTSIAHATPVESCGFLQVLIKFKTARPAESRLCDDITQSHNTKGKNVDTRRTEHTHSNYSATHAVHTRNSTCKTHHNQQLVRLAAHKVHALKRLAACSLHASLKADRCMCSAFGMRSNSTRPWWAASKPHRRSRVMHVRWGTGGVSGSTLSSTPLIVLAGRGMPCRFRVVQASAPSGSSMKHPGSLASMLREGPAGSCSACQIRRQHRLAAGCLGAPCQRAGRPRMALQVQGLSAKSGVSIVGQLDA